MLVVLGSNGFVGSAVVRELAEKHPGQVRAVVRKGSKRTRLEGIAGIEIVEGDTADTASLVKAMQGADTVLNFAAVTANVKNTDNLYWKVNVEGTRNSVTATEQVGIKRYILGSGLGTVQAKEGSYMRTRWEMEEAVRKSKLNWSIIQPSIMFGKGAEFFEAQARVMKTLPVAAVIGGGHTKFQPIFFKDVAKAVALTAERDDKIGKHIQLGGPEYFTFSELVNLIMRAAKISRPKLPLPMWAAKINAGLMSLLPKPPLTSATLELFDFDNITPDPQIIEHEFGFKPVALKHWLDENGIQV